MSAGRTRRELGFWSRIPPDERWAVMRRQSEAATAEILRPDRDRKVFVPTRAPTAAPRPGGGD